MSRSFSIDLCLKPCSIAIYGKFYLYRLWYFRPFSGLQIWSIKNALHFGSVKIHKIVCIRVYLVLTYTEKLFSTVCYFLSYFWRSVNESSQQTPQIFSGMLRNWGKVYIWGLLVFSFMGSSIPTFQYFFSFFHVVCKLLKSFFSHFFLVSKLYVSNLWFRRCPEA